MALATAITHSAFSQNTQIGNNRTPISSAESMKIGDVKPINQDSIMKTKIAEYATVKLTTDISKLSDNEKRMILILIDVAKIMDNLYWMQTWGDPNILLKNITCENEKKFVLINYGPWDRLDNNKLFVGNNHEEESGKKKESGNSVSMARTSDDIKKSFKFSEKPLGVNFYPKDMTKEEFEKLDNKDKKSLYTIIRRNEDRSLAVIWYHEAYKDLLYKAAELLRKASEISEDKEFGKYLILRAEALVTSNYQPSDFAWMDMKSNHIDFVVGPIENYEDALFEYKAAFESFVLVKDMEWSKKLDKYIAELPDLQKQLPVSEEYKKEVPGTSSDLGVYDAIYYAGDCNAGSKTIAINLPNDEQVQLKSGSRRLQLKNTMKAKFDNILLPIAKKLMDPTQMKNVKFDAFFNNVMFHEVAHGLGIKNTINGKGPVRQSLKDVYSAFEEAKADILGLFMVTKLIEKGEVADLTTEDCYVTFMAGIFRSVRFGASSAHGKANMMCFNFFEKAQAFKRTEKGTYMVDFKKMKKAVNDWAQTILVLQGNGDYEGAVKYLKENAMVNPGLQKELDGLRSSNIPKDIIFEQGTEVLGF
jgi:hypothetical protein